MRLGDDRLGELPPNKAGTPLPHIMASVHREGGAGIKCTELKGKEGVFLLVRRTRDCSRKEPWVMIIFMSQFE